MLGMTRMEVLRLMPELSGEAKGKWRPMVTGDLPLRVFGSPLDEIGGVTLTRKLHDYSEAAVFMVRQL